MHTSTTCSNEELQYIRGLYKKEIEDLLLIFKHSKLPLKAKWIREVIDYVEKNIW